MVKSRIKKSGFSYAGREDTPRLHPEQLVIQALKILMEENEKFLPIHEQNKCIGLVYLDDLIEFLIDDVPSGDLLSHKLNFDLESAIFAIHKQSNRH